MKAYQVLIRKTVTRIFGAVLLVCILTFLFDVPVFASGTSGAPTVNPPSVETPSPPGNPGGVSEDVTSDTVPYELGINFTTNSEDGGWTPTLQILLVMTILALAPSILIMVTSFTRIIIVLHFVRSALTTQTTPPNQVLIVFGLFLTFFIMSPVFSEINTEAIEPMQAGTITAEEAIHRGIEPIRDFMFRQTEPKDIQLFNEIAGVEEVRELEDIPTTTLIPAFIIGELRKAFIMGFIIYIPFLIIDMVVSSTLMSMGMMMLPPTTISMPFKILLFIMVDGWNLVIGELVRTFTLGGG